MKPGRTQGGSAEWLPAPQNVAKPAEIEGGGPGLSGRADGELVALVGRQVAAVHDAAGGADDVTGKI